MDAISKTADERFAEIEASFGGASFMIKDANPVVIADPRVGEESVIVITMKGAPPPDAKKAEEDKGKGAAVAPGAAPAPPAPAAKAPTPPPALDPPKITAVTLGVGFTVTGAASDTQAWNYMIIG